MSFLDSLKHAWNAFQGRDAPQQSLGVSSHIPSGKIRSFRSTERSQISAIYNKISMDVAALEFKHIIQDEDGRYIENVYSELNNCLSISANIDQTPRAFIQDLVYSMLDDGYVAAVPVDTNINPKGALFDISTIRVGKIVDWYPNHVRLKVYDERDGRKKEIVMPKKAVAIIENPFYAIMNEPNSTLQRLVRKLNMLDEVDEQSSAGKLDMIIQLPYVIKSEARREQAEKRRKEIEDQLSNSKYGIAYTDGTEHIQQLNRSLENNLLQQIQYLTDLLYSQLGMPKEVFQGNADEKVMLNYTTRTIEPIASAIVDEMTRKFLTNTARDDGETIKFFNDPFKLVPSNQLAELADKFTRNEIMSSNEFRQIIGLKPSNDPNADELRNKNLNPSQNGMNGFQNQQEEYYDDEEEHLDEEQL